MAFDKNEPADTTKIRNLGTILTDNFKGVQEGDSSFAPWAMNFIRRNGAAPSNDPAAIAENIILYSKDSDDNKAELYAINEDGDSYQITDGTPTLGTAGHTFLPGGLILKWGQVTFSGTNTTVTYPDPFPNNTFEAYLSPINSVAAARSYYTETYVVAGFNIVTLGNGTNQAYAWLALGN